MAELERYNPIDVGPKLARRFHEPILLLYSLNQALKTNLSSSFMESVDIEQSAESAFHCFVNKLGQLCDRECGGSTVTAFAVLQLPDRIQYRFASNELSEEKLELTKTFITGVLQYLCKADILAKQANTSIILRRSLAFNRLRVAVYIKSLIGNASLCVEACDRENSAEFSECSENLIHVIDQLYLSDVATLIRDRTKEGKIDESKFWCELRHSTGRLLSYLHSVKALIFARKRWPELYEDFEVSVVASTPPGECPFRNQPKSRRLTMKEIIGRMTSNAELMKSYRACAEYLEKFEIDKIIQKNVAFRPIVHAEVLLLDSLLKDGITHKSRFFNQYKYIGCSKPTCRLCEYYFQFHPSGVSVRPSHRNVYIKWRMPDVFPGKDTSATERTKHLMNKILDKIREDTFRALEEKMPEGKRHDSNTDPTLLNSDIISYAMARLGV